MRQIKTTLAPNSFNSSSQAIGVSSGYRIVTAGQLGINPKTQLWGETFKEQASLAISNALAIIEAGGGRITNVIEVNVFMLSRNDLPNFDVVYRKFFKKPYPALTIVGTSWLPAAGEQALLEVKMTAVIPDQTKKSIGA